MPASELDRTLRLDAEFFRKAHVRAAYTVRSRRHDSVAAVAAVSDGNHFTISADFVDEGIPYYRGQDVVGNFFIEQAAPNRITQEAYNRPYMRRSHLKKGDVLLSIVGTIGELSLVANETPATCSCKLAILRPRTIRPEFLAVALHSGIGRLQIERQTRGTVQMGFILEDLDQLLVPRFDDSLEERIANLVVAAKRCRTASTDGLLEAEKLLALELGLSPESLPELLSYSHSASLVRAAGRLDSQYFMPAKTETIRRLAALPGTRLGDVYESVRDLVDPTKLAHSKRVRIFDVTHALEPVLDDDQVLAEFEQVGSTKKRIKAGDVVISRLRAYLKEIAIVKCSETHPALGSTEFIVLRPKDTNLRIAAATLMTFLRSQPVQTILKWCQDGSQHPRFGEKDLLAIPFPDAVANAALYIEPLVDKALAARDRAQKLIAAAKSAVDIAVEEGEPGAIRFLDELEG